ncbi:helix-turn-helix domain-containing protein [Photobacterium leiognathi]|uniref:helix-turn-helix domain-containing protein n=1 Tax=Photobacterium leiognathi TaxID=553611 RepID=UPI0029811613|nr:helix-turn-helix domain-containing protein [Photobacterium leiognathi]
MLSSENFHQLARREKNGQARIRLLALAHLQEGKSREDVAASLKVSVSSVNNWLRRYCDEGIDGMTTKPRSGRPCALSDSQQAQLIAFITEQKKQAVKLKGRDVQGYIEQHFAISFELSHIYRLLKQLKVTLKP